jgi:hypothetical protein
MRVYSTLFILGSFFRDTYVKSSKDREAANKVVTSFINSWNNHDFKDINSYATIDFTYINPPGILFNNGNELQNNLQSRRQTIFRNTPSKEESRDVPFIAPNAAIVTLIDTIGRAESISQPGIFHNIKFRPV